jgi:hypothetical protein
VTALGLVATAFGAAPKPHLFMVLIDDLGYHNGEQFHVSEECAERFSVHACTYCMWVCACVSDPCERSHAATIHLQAKARQCFLSVLTTAPLVDRSRMHARTRT